MNGALWAVVVVLAVACGWLVWQVFELRGAISQVPLGDDELYSLIHRIDNEVGAHETAIEDLRERLSIVEPRVIASLQHTGVVAYDAYDDVGGNRSRSIAFLDDRASGLVLTLLVSRTDSQFYLKRVTRGTGEEPLSPEERTAVERALQG